jgi:hypothetical protein
MPVQQRRQDAPGLLQQLGFVVEVFECRMGKRHQESTVITGERHRTYRPVFDVILGSQAVTDPEDHRVAVVITVSAQGRVKVGRGALGEIIEVCDRVTEIIDRSSPPSELPGSAII